MRVIEAQQKHVRDAISWMVARGLPELPESVFSTSGFAVEGVACLFLYLTNSSIAYLEMLVSNPKAKQDERALAQGLVIEACLARAKQNGCSTVLAPIERRDVLERALAHGFTVVARDVSLAAFPIGGA